MKYNDEMNEDICVELINVIVDRIDSKQIDNESYSAILNIILNFLVKFISIGAKLNTNLDTEKTYSLLLDLVIHGLNKTRSEVKNET